MSLVVSTSHSCDRRSRPRTVVRVKNLGDGLMVVFQSAAQAVQAGAEVQRLVARRNRRNRHPLVVRVGIAVGDADVEDDDYFGLPVVQAARLCAACPGGEVLCTAAVQLLGGGRTDVAFESVGDLELKGLDAPVQTVRWSRPTRTTMSHRSRRAWRWRSPIASSVVNVSTRRRSMRGSERPGTVGGRSP